MRRFMTVRPRTVTGVSLCLLVGLLAGWTVARGQTSSLDSVEALREGNRLFREGRFDQAYEAYLGGWDAGAPHPVLLYNLATTAHHLGRLPEAVLWYRRAERANPGDPWVEQNLHQARAALGLEPYPPPGFASWLAPHRTTLYYVAAALVWLGLALWTLRPRRSLRLAVALGLAGLALYATTAVASRSAATPAVLIEDCSDPSADLPAGSEIWLVASLGDSFETVVHGTRIRCPASAVREIDTLARPESTTARDVIPDTD